MIKSILLSMTLAFTVFASNAQTIPNGDFENWTTNGSYETPNSWGTLNASTSPLSVFTATKGTPGTSGSSYLKLTSKMVATTVVNGIAVCGTIDLAAMKFSGFPMTARPTSLTGKWQHMIYGSSQGNITVTLSRWDAGMNMRMPVGGGSVTLSGMAMSWASFSIPITYVDGNTPDTCLIVMQASGTTPTVNDYLWVDNLAFAGSSTGLNSVENNLSNVHLYPNPVTDNLNIGLSLTNTQDVTVNIMDVTGKVIATKKYVTLSGVSTQTVDLSSLSEGIYFVAVSAGEATAVRKITIQ